MEQVDAIVVGAGVVGLAVAERLSQTLSSVLVIDRHTAFGEETSSRNSEVIHAGIYYSQGSLKAKMCVEGKRMLYAFCEAFKVPFQRTGKFIVAQNPAETAYLEQTLIKAQNNGVMDLKWYTATELKMAEPALNAQSALFSPSTGIIDSHGLMQALLAKTEQQGGFFVGQTEFMCAAPSNSGFDVQLQSQGQAMRMHCRYLINCAGLNAQKVATEIEGMQAQHVPPIHWCRGHYFSYSGRSPFKHLIYPVPEANGAGLGIHATLDLAGQIKFGPDTEYIDQLDYRVSESLHAKFYQAIQRYFPDVDADRLVPAYAGIRPKLQGPNDPFQDFVIHGNSVHGLPGLINLFGIESPGLTSCLAIAHNVAQMIELDR